MRYCLSIIFVFASLSVFGQRDKLLKNDSAYICDNKFSEVYHVNEGCSNLAECESPVRIVPIMEAKADNRKLCTICKMYMKADGYSGADRLAEPVRCKATLKNGEQCPRYTTNPQQLCGRHDNL